MYTHSNEDEASTPIVTYHHSKYTTINDHHHHHLLSDNEEGSFRFFVPSGDENDNNGNNSKSRLTRNCCCCCPCSSTNQWCYHLMITLVIGSVLILFTTIVAYASVHFLHANLQCSHVELANSDSETIHFAQFASRVKKLTIQSNGITKTFMKRSSSTNSLSKRNGNNNNMNVKSIDDDEDDDERLLITVSRYSQSSDGYKRLNTSLIFNEETGHLILDSHVPNDLLKNDCVYVERTVSIPMNFLSSSSSSNNNNGDGSGPRLDIEFPPGIGDVEFVRLEDDDDNKKKKESDGAEDDDYTFSFKSLTIERHSGDIIMDSVYCSDIVNVSTHHGDIHMYSVAAQKRGIVMNVVSIGDVLYEDLFAPVVNASVQTGDIKGQFIYGLPTLQQVNFLTSTGSQSHSRIVNVNSTQSYVTNNGNIKMVMKPYEFEGNFDITSGKRGSVVVNHFNKDQITYTVNSKSSKQGTIQFGTSAHQQNTSPKFSSLQIAVLKTGNVNVMLDV